MGSRRDARTAGYMPKKMPTNALNANAPSDTDGSQIDAQTLCARLRVYHRRDKLREKADRVRKTRAERDADQPAQTRNGSRFDQELQQNVAAFRADGLANADLPRSLRHRHEHDVHDADAAHEQGQPGYRAENDAENRQNLVDAVENVLLAVHMEAGNVVVAAHQVLPYLIHRHD